MVEAEGGKEEQRLNGEVTLTSSEAGKAWQHGALALLEAMPTSSGSIEGGCHRFRQPFGAT